MMWIAKSGQKMLIDPGTLPYWQSLGWKTDANANAIADADESASSGAGLPATVVSKTANYTAAAGEFVEANSSGGGFTVTLPTNPAVGALVSVKKISSDTNTLTIAPASGGTIDGDANATTTTQWAGAVFECTDATGGANKWRIAASMTTTGPAGPAGTIAVGTVTTGAAGSSVAVTNAGTPTAAVLNFAIPKGDTGAAGSIANVQNQGSGVTARGTLNFTGAGITATDDAANSRTNVQVNALGSNVFGFPTTMPLPLAVTNQSLSSRIYFVRAWGSGTITKIRIQVGTASGNICVGVFAGGTSGVASAQPGARTGTSGSVACPASGVQDITLTGSVVVNEGDWFAIMADNATATFGTNGLGSVSTLYQGQSGFQSTGGTTLPLPSSSSVAQWESKVFWMVGVA